MRDLKIDVVYIGLLFIAFTLPFSILTNNISIILCLLPICIGLFEGKFRLALLANMINNSIALLLVAFALTYIISGLVHLNNYDDTSILFNDLEKRAVFLAFPIIFAVVPMLTKFQIRNIILSFFISVILSSILSIVLAGYVSFSTGSLYNLHPKYGGLENNFMYHRLGSYLDLHAVYYSSMVLTAFALAMIYTRTIFTKTISNQLIYYGIVLLYLLLFLLLLKSAIILLGLTIIISSYGFVQMIKARRNLGSLRITFILLGSLVIFLVIGSRIIDKIGSKGNLLNYNIEEPSGGQWNVISLRRAKWDVAVEAIGDYWLLGVGPGNIYSVLDSYYEVSNFKVALRDHYNPHNQFLHSFLILGIVGFIIILSIYFVSYYLAFRKRDIIWLLFLIGISLFSLTESILAVNKGIVVFVFFACLFSYLPSKTSTYFK